MHERTHWAFGHASFTNRWFYEIIKDQLACSPLARSRSSDKCYLYAHSARSWGLTKGRLETEAKRWICQRSQSNWKLKHFRRLLNFHHFCLDKTDRFFKLYFQKESKKHQSLMAWFNLLSICLVISLAVCLIISIILIITYMITASNGPDAAYEVPMCAGAPIIGLWFRLSLFFSTIWSNHEDIFVAAAFRIFVFSLYYSNSTDRNEFKDFFMALCYVGIVTIFQELFLVMTNSIKYPEFIAFSFCFLSTGENWQLRNEAFQSTWAKINHSFFYFVQVDKCYSKWKLYLINLNGCVKRSLNRNSAHKRKYQNPIQSSPTWIFIYKCRAWQCFLWKNNILILSLSLLLCGDKVEYKRQTELVGVDEYQQSTLIQLNAAERIDAVHSRRITYKNQFFGDKMK